MRHETHFCYTRSLQGFDYGNVVHQFEKRCKPLLYKEQQVSTFLVQQLIALVLWLDGNKMEK